MGATCLQDAPYMAMYECYDSFAAFERYLDLAGPDLIPSVKLLLTEYCRHALHRAWWYYPDALPEGAIAESPRNGRVDRRLNLPVEDLYPDGQQAGQVGQEVYGGGAAMIFATRSHHRIEGAPFVLFCDHFLRALTRIDRRTVSFLVDGAPGMPVEIAAIPTGRTAMPALRLRAHDGRTIEPEPGPDGDPRWRLGGAEALLLAW